LTAPALLPTTSYGYLPPVGASAHGWVCPDWDCGLSAAEPVPRWPWPCPACGTPTDPMFDPPWDHDAEGAELGWTRRAHPERVGSYLHGRWLAWQIRDALARDDRAAVTAVRRSAAESAARLRSTAPSFVPGDVFADLVRLQLQDDPDAAAEDLLAWLATSSTADMIDRSARRLNTRQLIAVLATFFAAPEVTGLPRATDVRTAALRFLAGELPATGGILQETLRNRPQH
jgi:hypothetical protein